MRSTLALALALALLSPALATAEDVELPAYKSWASRPVGTSVAIRSLTASPASTITTTTTYKLLEVREDKLILQTQKTSDATGRKVVGLPDKYEQRRMFPLFPGLKKEDIGKPPKDAIAKGEETLKLAGREIKTFWYDTKGTGDAGATETRMWLSDDIPNRLVKSVTKIPKASTTVTLELVEMTVPTP